MCLASFRPGVAPGQRAAAVRPSTHLNRPEPEPGRPRADPLRMERIVR